MTEQQTLVEFLTARLDEDEAAARATLIDVDGSGDWRADEHPVAWTVDLYRVRDRNARPVVEEIRSLDDDDDPDNITEYVNGSAVAQHIARHDPARILREVAAKREFLNRAKRALHDADTLEKVGSQSVDVFTIRAPAEYTLTLLAAPYSDHPDYREEWRP